MKHFWTKKPPVKEGYYWWRENLSMLGVVSRIIKKQAYFAGPLASGQGRDILWLKGEWLGPIEEPPDGDAIENCQRKPFDFAGESDIPQRNNNV